MSIAEVISLEVIDGECINIIYTPQKYLLLLYICWMLKHQKVGLLKLEVSANNVVHQDSSRNSKVVMKFTQQNSPGHIAMSKGNIVR